MRWLLQDIPGEEDPQEEGGLLLFYGLVALALVLMAGLMSGLTLGLLSMDATDLELLKRSGTARERRHAEKIAPVLSNQHFLLVTLVLCNAACTEALPIFLDRLTSSPVTAVLLSITVVLILGEIAPQAVCSKYGLAVGAGSAWFVRGLMWLAAPVAWPISKLLDYLLGGAHSALFRRARLQALVDMHSEAEGLGGDLTEDEVGVIRGALDLSHKTAATCMTPLDKVFMLTTDTELNEATLNAVLDSGHSRIPVHRPGDRRDVVGLILVKELINVDRGARLRAGGLKLRSLPSLRSDTRLYDMLRLFETGRIHMALLRQAGPGRNPHSARHTQHAEHAQHAAEHEAGPHSTPIAIRGDAAAAAGGEPAERAAAAADGAAATASTPLLDGHANGTGGAAAAELDAPRTPSSLTSTLVRTWERLLSKRSAEVSPLGAPGGPEPSPEGEPDGAVADPPPPVPTAAPGEVVGILCLEDVIEELLQQEIVDETDQFVDNDQLQRVNAALLMRSLPRHLRMLLRAQKTRVGPLGDPVRRGLANPLLSPPIESSPVNGGAEHMHGLTSRNTSIGEE